MHRGAVRGSPRRIFALSALFLLVPAGALSLPLLLLAEGGRTGGGRGDPPLPPAPLPGQPPPPAGAGPYVLEDDTKVYYGDPKKPFARPAVLELDKVFGAIPEYRRILDEKLAPDDPTYWVLLEQTNKRFTEAVKAVAEWDGYDLVAEVTVLKPIDPTTAPPIPDITDKVVDVIEAPK